MNDYALLIIVSAIACCSLIAILLICLQFSDNTSYQELNTPYKINAGRISTVRSFFVFLHLVLTIKKT